MTQDEIRAALLHVAALLEAIAEQSAPTPAPQIVSYERESLAWLDDVLPTTHADPLAHVDETLLLGDETLLVPKDEAGEPGTGPAKDLDLDLDLVHVLPGAPGRMGGRGEGNLDFPTDEITAKFSLTEPHPKPRAETFRPSLFDEFWAAYPRHVGKQAAFKAFAKLQPTAALVARLIDAIEAQRSTRDWREGFIPHASTWLNGERWADEVEAVPPNSSAAKRIAIQRRAIGPRAEGGSWRERCTHTPECQTPTQCEAARLREVTA